jgi:hypothetical protein
MKVGSLGKKAAIVSPEAFRVATGLPPASHRGRSASQPSGSSPASALSSSRASAG